ncbi:MAG: peptidoglycan-associated lipoprotein Pal [Deltaproteobacteria bacterium]|nr:peptidoglycan-associated lipoprotein Pal [Deltaproteobacteria bacterium]
MSRGNAKIIIVFFMAVSMITGCAGHEKTEDISSTAPLAIETAKQTAPEPAGTKEVEIVPPDTMPVSASDTAQPRQLASETIKQEEIKAMDGQVKKAALQTIYFDYDMYIIRDSEKDNLAMNAKWLSANKTAKVRIEGHADERGEEEYNLALGDKRARGVKNYLQSMGIDQERLSTLSYGEERPAAQGQDETAWAKNRRVEFKLIN